MWCFTYRSCVCAHRCTHPQGLTPYGHSLFSKVDPKVISEAWRLVVRRETDVALSKFARILSRITDELMIELSRYLRAQQYVNMRTEKLTGRAVNLKRRRLAVFGCPYLCSGQMLYFLECQLLDAVFGVAAHTLMGFSRVVTNIDFVTRKFEWVNKAQLLQAWHITDQQLADACILAGNEYCHTLPHVNAIAPQFTFDVAIQLARGGPLSMYLQVNLSINIQPIAQTLLHCSLPTPLLSHRIMYKPASSLSSVFVLNNDQPAQLVVVNVQIEVCGNVHK